MKKRFTLPKENGSKKRDICKANCSTHLYEDDYSEIIRLCRAEGVGESEALRLIVSEWIRMKKVMALGKDQTEDPVRRIYERVIDERISPLSDSLAQLKTAVEKLSESGAVAEIASPVSPGTQPQPQSGDILSALTKLQETLDRTNFELSESSSSQISLLDDIYRSQRAAQGIGCETFAAAWMITDFLVRYMVELSLRKGSTNPSDVEAEVIRDRVGLRLEGLSKISAVERLFDLPEDFHLARLLGERIFPVADNTPASQLP